MSTKKILTGVLSGLVAGVVLGILFAPDKGSNTRQKISSLGDDLIDSIKDKLNQYSEIAKDELENFKNDAEDLVEKGKSKAEQVKSDFNNVIS